MYFLQQFLFSQTSILGHSSTPPHSRVFVPSCRGRGWWRYCPGECQNQSWRTMVFRFLFSVVVRKRLKC